MLEARWATAEAEALDVINRQAINEYLDRELDSWLWMKKLRREALEAELRCFRVQPKFKTRPWLHQLACFYLGMCQPQFLFLLKMGLGKTKILADLMTQAQRERTMTKALITVPHVINMGSWRDDLEQHSDLEPMVCDVSDIEEKWERLANPGTCDVTVINYQGLALAVSTKKNAKKGKKLVRDEKKIRHLQKLYDFIGIDESHYLKGKDTHWFGIMHQLTKGANHVYGSTGTLFGKDPADVWSQFYLVDQGETFSDSFGLFRGAFFSAESNGFGLEYTFLKRRMADLNKMIGHRSIRYDYDDVDDIDLPTRVNVVQTVEFREEQRAHYLRALQGLIDAQGGGSSGLEAPWIRMRQIIAGYLAWNDARGSHVVRFKENPKLEALEALLEDLGDDKLVVCHEYTETGKLITERLTELKIKHVWLYGGTKDKAACRDTFMADPACRVFVMNSKAGGTGNDGLQKVCRYMCFYESPTTPTVREQTISRLHRPGQRERVFVYDLVLKRSTDKGILEDIAAGRDMYEAIISGRRLRQEIR
mgnify:CR=1 FL=1